MKVVLDTNVVVSGTFWTGASYKILELVSQNKISLIISLKIIEEYNKIINSEEILEKTTSYQQARIKSLQNIVSNSILVEPKEKLEIIKADLDDNKFLEAAIEGKVEYIISNDKKHLLILKKFRNILIVTPEEFLNQYKDSTDPVGL